MNLESKIEAILFYKNEPVSIRALSKLLDESEKNIRDAVSTLSNSLGNRGITLVETNEDVELGTNKELAPLIESVMKEEMRESIGKAGLETLSIIMYRGCASRSEIDYIRGVNSSFTLRNLNMRGLIERDTNTEDQRVIKYKGTLQLLGFLGLKNLSELPNISEFKSKIGELEANKISDE